MTPIGKSTTVRELLEAHPEVFSVLENHGMCADCQADPPSVPLSHFAEKHCAGDVESLLSELRSAIGKRD